MLLKKSGGLENRVNRTREGGDGSRAKVIEIASEDGGFNTDDLGGHPDH